MTGVRVTGVRVTGDCGTADWGQMSGPESAVSRDTTSRCRPRRPLAQPTAGACGGARRSRRGGQQRVQAAAAPAPRVPPLHPSYSPSRATSQSCEFQLLQDQRPPVPTPAPQPPNPHHKLQDGTGHHGGEQEGCLCGRVSGANGDPGRSAGRRGTSKKEGQGTPASALASWHYDVLALCTQCTPRGQPGGSAIATLAAGPTLGGHRLAGLLEGALFAHRVDQHRQQLGRHLQRAGGGG